MTVPEPVSERIPEPIPEPQRARLSGYVQGHMLLPWKWVDARMSSARNYWIATTSRGFPASRPVWGIWQSPELWFSAGSSIASNLRRDDRIQVNLESADEVVIIEGHCKPLAEAAVASWAEPYNSKYNWEMPVSTADVWQVVPHRVLAWISDPSGLDNGATFTNSATEWRFGTE